MKRHILILLLAVIGCSATERDLPMVRSDDPVWQLNPDRWEASVNDLTLPPGEGAPHPLAAPVWLRSDKVAVP